ncbi:MAG: hypothetical protein WC426_00100 [Sulfuriferula sp.]
MTKPSLPPSLLENANDYQTKNAGPSLLTSLSSSISPPPAKKRGHPLLWFVVLPLILISIVVAAAMTITEHINTPTSASRPVHSSAKPNAVPAAAVIPEPAPIQTATIINDPLTNNPHDRLTNALAGTQASTPKPLVTEPIPAKATASSPTLTDLRHTAATITTKKPATDKVHTSEPDDHDVKLLTALVATTPIAKEQPAKTHESKTKYTNNKLQTKSIAKEDSRDVVERKPGDSTANLLARCKKLGMIEGELCRWRICADRWDTDPVCKANAHPKASTPDNPAQ